MADFLTRLADRTLGLAPVAQPMIAPMFAPGPAASADALPLPAQDAPLFQPEATEEIGQAVPALEIQESFPRPDPATPLLTPPDEPPSIALDQPGIETPPPRPEPIPQTESAPSQPEGDEALPLPPRVSESAIENRNLASEQLERREAPPSPAILNVQPIPPALPENSPDTLRMEEVAPVRLEPVEARTLPVQRPGSRSASEPSTENQAQRVEADNALQEPAPVSTISVPLRPDRSGIEAQALSEAMSEPTPQRAFEPAVVRPQVVSSFEPVKSPLESEQPSASEALARPPVIRVTIGRIEVRAVSPPAPSRVEPSRPGPALSLDDYLKQRNRGPS